MSVTFKVDNSVIWKCENLVDAVMYDIELVESDKMPPAEIDLRKNSGIEDCH